MRISSFLYTFILVGTSSVVYPAAELVQYFRYTPLKFCIDPVPSLRLKSFGTIKGKSEEKNA